MKLNLFPSGSITPLIPRYRNLELGESHIVDNMTYVPPRESTEEEDRYMPCSAKLLQLKPFYDLKRIH